MKHRCQTGTWFADDETRTIRSQCRLDCGKIVDLKDGKRLYEAYDWGVQEGRNEAREALRTLGNTKE